MSSGLTTVSASIWETQARMNTWCLNRVTCSMGFKSSLRFKRLLMIAAYFLFLCGKLVSQMQRQLLWLCVLLCWGPAMCHTYKPSINHPQRTIPVTQAKSHKAFIRVTLSGEGRVNKVFWTSLSQKACFGSSFIVAWQSDCDSSEVGQFWMGDEATNSGCDTSKVLT